MNMKNIDWIASGFSILGVVLNAYKIILCWPIWIISNILWIYYTTKNKQYAALVLWITFLLFNIFGWYQWTR